MRKMKVGLSTYSLRQALDRKELTVPDAIRWIADQGGQRCGDCADGLQFDRQSGIH